MAKSSGGCGVCKNELNAQIQVLMSRVETLEENVSTQWETMLLNLVKNIAAFTSISTSAAAILATDPNLLVLLQGASGLENLIKSLPGVDWRKILLQMAMDRLCSVLPDDIQISITASLTAKVASIQIELDAAIAGGAGQAIIDEIEERLCISSDSLVSISGFFSVSGNASKCKTASSILGL